MASQMDGTNAPIQETTDTDPTTAKEVKTGVATKLAALLGHRTKAGKDGTRSIPLPAVLILITLLAASVLFGGLAWTRYQRAEEGRRGLLSTALGAASVEFRTAHYSLQSFLESGDPSVLSEARAVFGPTVRLASKVLASAGKDDLIDNLGTSSDKLAEALGKIAERTKYYGKVQDLDKRVIEKVIPNLLSLADATVTRTGAAASPAPGTLLADADRQTALSSSHELEVTADSYLTMGVMPEDKPVPEVGETQAVEWARKGMGLGADYTLESVVEKYSRWQGTHYWEITFDQSGKNLIVYINADAPRIAGYQRSDHATLAKGEMPAITRGEALVKARTILPQIPDAPKDLVVGHVEFMGTWQITFWPRVNGVIYYSHPITIWVDAKTHQPYGYQYLRKLVRPGMPVNYPEGYAIWTAKKMAETGWMKEAFAQYRGDAYLALYRSDITGEDTPVWAVEFVISSRFHENTGYDMAIVLINSKTGRYEGYKGLGDGQWRVDRWQLK